MSARGFCALLGALSCLSCVGPTLEVGERIVLPADGGADTNDFDAGDSAVRVRDAGFGDRDFHLEERRQCRDERDCAFNVYRDHCSTMRFVCVECTDDRQCESGRCADPEGYCRPVERHDGPDLTSP